MLKRGIYAVVACALSVGLGRVSAQDKFSYPGCTDVSQTDFNQVTVLDKSKDATLDEVIRFSVTKDGSVFFAERGGSIKVVKPAGTVVKLGKVNSFPTTSQLGKQVNNINNEFGLVGLAADPDFETNHFLYVTYQTPAGVDSTHLSRITVANDVLDMASEKVLLSWPTQKDYCCHTGGDIRIDSKGDLWVSVGNNTLNAADDNAATAYVDASIPNSAADDNGHSANTNDLRGKILRIHPTADGKYTIPAGNFKEYFASMYTADQLAKIRPEIYTMGHRNPYTIAVDDVTGLLSWGDVGPDVNGMTEELNLVSHPGFMGWPYFVGAVGNPNYVFKLNKNPASPENTSVNNTGVQKLPPAEGAIIGYQQAAAITGPIYHYSPSQTSPKKLPGQFDGKWFVTDWKNDGFISAVTLGNNATSVVSKTKFFTGAGGGFLHPIQVSIGPDGMMYVLDYYNLYNFGTFKGQKGVMDTPFSTTPPKLYRIEFKGTPCAATTALNENRFARAESGMKGLINLGLNGNRIVTVPLGAKIVRLYDLQGKLAWESKVSNSNGLYSQSLDVPASLGNGVYRVKFSF